MATNVCATITPAVVNGSVMPNHRSRYWPTQPAPARARRTGRRRPTTGGSTIDSVQSARTSPRPGNEMRASSQASGTPKSIDSAVAHSEQPDRQPQRRERAVGGEDRPGVAPRRLPQQPDEGQREERDADDGQHERRRRQALPPDLPAAGGRRRRRRASWSRRLARSRTSPGSPDRSVPSRKLMNASSTAAFCRRLDRGDRVLGDDVDVVGNGDARGLVAGGGDVGDVDDAGVGLTGRDLGDDALHVLLQADRRHRDAGRGRGSAGRTCRTAPPAAHSTTFRSGLARSATPVMPFGLPGATMIASRLVAKTTGAVPLARPSSACPCSPGRPRRTRRPARPG